MKKSIVLLAVALLFWSAPMMAQTDSTKTENQDWQQKTAFKPGNTEITSGVYGAATLRVGEINHQNALMLGAKGLWIINHKLGIGMAGTGMMTASKQTALTNVYTGYSGGYGGLIIEPIFFADKLVHFTVPMIFGGGAVGKYTYYAKEYVGGDEYVAFLAFEPGLEVEVNLMKWFRISAGGYYLFTSEVDSFQESTDILNPFSIGVNFKFGLF